MSRKAKSVLRRKYLDLRRNIPRPNLATKKSRFFKRLKELLAGMRIHGLCLYSSILNEPEVCDLAKVCDLTKVSGLHSCRIFFPRVKGCVLEFVEGRDTRKFQRSRLGIMEPGPGYRVLSASSFKGPNKVVVFLVPAIVFDRNGGRIGFGKGYYDSFLSRMERAGWFRTIRIGVAWDFQVRNADLPVGRRDIRMDMIVTERRVIDCMRGS